MIFVTGFGPNAPAQEPAPQVVAPRIVWGQIAGVERYRLQIASDYEFQDVLLDRLVVGREHQPTGLTPGTYYWRVAPSQFSTGRFAKPTLLRVRAVEMAPVAHQPKPLREVPGWWAGTGKVGSLSLLENRSRSVGELVVVNASQTVYLLDANTGVTRWVAPFGTFAMADRVFSPIHLPARNGSLLAVAFEDGVRALSVATGREEWRLELGSRPFAGEVMGGPDASGTLFLIDDRRDGLLVLDATTGEVRRKLKLNERTNAPPIDLPGRGMLLQGNRKFKLLNAQGDEIDSIGLSADATTPAISVQSSRGPVLLVGTRAGLEAFSTHNFQPLGRLPFSRGAYPVGRLVAADLNGDGLSEVLMLSSDNQISAVNVGKGDFAWSIEPKSRPDSIAAVDLDQDGKDEILLVGRDHRLVAFSGAAGSEIWRSDLTLGASPSHLAAGKGLDGRFFVIAADASGVRTLEVTRAARSRRQESR